MITLVAPEGGILPTRSPLDPRKELISEKVPNEAAVVVPQALTE